MTQSASKFDASAIVFSFGVLSDFHIKQDADAEKDNREKLISAISQLRDRAKQNDPNGLSLLVAAGDLTHDGKAEERRKEREAKRDNRERCKKYNEAHREERREYARKRRLENPGLSAADSAFYRQKRKLLQGVSV